MRRTLVAASATLHVAEVDDAPVIDAPETLSATEDEVLRINGLSVSDTDYGGEDLEVHLTVQDGSLQYENYFVSATEPMVLTGTLSEINAKLSGGGREYRADYDVGITSPAEGGVLTSVTTEHVVDDSEWIFVSDGTTIRVPVMMKRPKHRVICRLSS